MTQTAPNARRDHALPQTVGAGVDARAEHPPHGQRDRRGDGHDRPGERPLAPQREPARRVQARRDRGPADVGSAAQHHRLSGRERRQAERRDAGREGQGRCVEEVEGGC